MCPFMPTWGFTDACMVPQAKLQHSKLLLPTPGHLMQHCQGKIWRECIKMDSRADPGFSHPIPTQTTLCPDFIS